MLTSFPPCLQVLRSMKLYGAEKDFEAALEWLNQWACSRSFGLGTRCSRQLLNAECVCVGPRGMERLRSL